MKILENLVHLSHLEVLVVKILENLWLLDYLYYLLVLVVKHLENLEHLDYLLPLLASYLVHLLLLAVPDYLLYPELLAHLDHLENYIDFQANLHHLRMHHSLKLLHYF